MLIWKLLIGMIDWFIPESAKAERSELSLARNFVFTHQFGPLLSQSIALFLYLSDPHHGVACWTVIICIWLFWTLPLVYKLTGNLQLSALISVELLAFTSLFGAYYYGGGGSPVLPPLLFNPFLGFFFFFRRSLPFFGFFFLPIFCFFFCFFSLGVPVLLLLQQLSK